MQQQGRAWLLLTWLRAALSLPTDNQGAAGSLAHGGCSERGAHGTGGRAAGAAGSGHIRHSRHSSLTSTTTARMPNEIIMRRTAVESKLTMPVDKKVQVVCRLQLVGCKRKQGGPAGGRRRRPPRPYREPRRVAQQPSPTQGEGAPQRSPWPHLSIHRAQPLLVVRACRAAQV